MLSTHPVLSKLKAASEGLLFTSESDYPLKPVYFEEFPFTESILKKFTGKPANTLVETTTLPYFFRNVTKINPGLLPNQQQTAQRFQALKQLLQQELHNIVVYRVGTVKIDVFIVGALAHNGGYAGLHTTVVET